MADSGGKTIDEIDDLFELVNHMNMLGIKCKGLGLNTLKELKDHAKQELSKRKETQGLSAGKAFSILSETKQEDFKKRQRLEEYYIAANKILDQDRIIFDHVEKSIGNVKERIKGHIEQMQRLEQKGCYLLVAGETSSGKSRLVNLILGEEILPYSILSSTSTICELKFGKERKIKVHFKENRPAQTIVLEPPTAESSGKSYLDQISSFVHIDTDREKGSSFKKIELFWPHSLLEEGIVIVDSPGIGENAKMDEVVIQYLPEAFAFIYVINSANAGGVQQDRLVSLLQKVREVSLADQKREKEGRGDKITPILQDHLLSKCALFVCNKWDQVPEREIKKVKGQVTERLEKYWPSLDPKSQIIYLSTQKATEAQNAGYISEDFSSLMDGLKYTVLKSIEARLEFHWRWLDYLLQKINFSAKAFLMNASLKHGEVEAKMTQITCRLNSIEKNQEKTMHGLRKCFDEKVKEASQKLYAYLSSERVISRFASWTKDTVPEVEGSWKEMEEGIKIALSSRLKEVIKSWEEKNNVLRSARAYLIESFEKHYLDVRGQLREANRAIIEENGNLASPNNIFSSSSTTEIVTRVTGALSLIGVGIAGFALNPVFLLGLPLAPSVLFFKEVKGYLSGRQYQRDKASFMTGPSERFLKDFTNLEQLEVFVRGELKEVETYLNNMKDRLPKLIEADKELCKQLAGDKRSQAEKEKLYRPIFDDSLKQRSQLAIFGITEVCSTSICSRDLEWSEDDSSTLGRGSFATVYGGKFRRHGEDQIVALKVFHKNLCEENAIAIMDEIYILRKLEHPHIVKFHSIVKDIKDKASIRVITVLEKCEENLKTRIFNHPESIPGTSRNRGVAKEVCRWAKEICDGLVYIHGQQIVHRDLTLENILVSKDNSVRIADVGVAKALVDTVTGTVTGTCVYMAPEVLHGVEYNSKADIYSLGIMLWEMWYGKEATLRDVDLGITSLEQFRKLVVDGCRPEHLEACEEPSTRWKNVVTQCWKGNSEDRPTAAVCATEMRMEQMELDEAVSSISIGYEELEWKEYVPSSFADRAVGHVFQGIMKQKDHAQTAVTLKLCREGFEAINAKETVKLMKQLRSLNHDHIVHFFGVSLCMRKEIAVMTLVLERCTESLRNYTFGHSASRARASKQAAWEWAKEITKGLEYIHDQGFIHGHLKLENIWVHVSETKKKLAKIAVIGMESLAKDITGAVAETPIYMAPEVLRGEKYDNKADIYSMGLMFWEMTYGRMVSWDISEGLKREDVLCMVEKGYRPEILDHHVPVGGSLSQWIQLMKGCWDKDPTSRPMAKECGKRIDEVEKCYADEQFPEAYVMLQA